MVSVNRDSGLSYFLRKHKRNSKNQEEKLLLDIVLADYWSWTLGPDATAIQVYITTFK